MLSVPCAFILFPLPILMVAFGVKAESPIGRIIGVTGAFLWYFCLGMNGTYIAILGLIGWGFLYFFFRAIFTPRGW